MVMVPERSTQRPRWFWGKWPGAGVAVRLGN